LGTNKDHVLNGSNEPVTMWPALEYTLIVLMPQPAQNRLEIKFQSFVKCFCRCIRSHLSGSAYLCGFR